MTRTQGDVSGDFTVEASWWNGRFAWSQSVQAVVLTPPVLAVHVHAPVCWGDSAWVEWTAPDSGSVFIGEMDVTDLPGWAVHETNVTTIQWVQSPGCGLDTVVVVEFPDSANVAWDIQSPACAGETGQGFPHCREEHRLGRQIGRGWTRPRCLLGFTPLC